MKPVYQEFPEHKPEQGIIGDCIRAALASLLELPVSAIPHFARDTWPDHEAAVKAYNTFLAKRGLLLLECESVDFDALRRMGAWGLLSPSHRHEPGRASTCRHWAQWANRA